MDIEISDKLLQLGLRSDEMEAFSDWYNKKAEFIGRVPAQLQSLVIRPSKEDIIGMLDFVDKHKISLSDAMARSDNWVQFYDPKAYKSFMQALSDLNFAREIDITDFDGKRQIKSTDRRLKPGARYYLLDDDSIQNVFVAKVNLDMYSAGFLVDLDLSWNVHGRPRLFLTSTRMP